jgi:hypothetical protein
MSLNVPRSRLCQTYYILVDKMYREFMDDKISWRQRTDAPEVWKHRREIQELTLPHEAGNYEVDFWKYEPGTDTWKRVKKLGSASDLQARAGTWMYEYEGLPNVVAAKTNPESYKFYEECLHLEAKRRRIRGELYDMNNQESVGLKKRCDLVDAYRRSLDEKLPPLGPIRRVRGISPTAQEFVRLKKDKHTTGSHVPRLTRGSRHRRSSLGLQPSIKNIHELRNTFCKGKSHRFLANVCPPHRSKPLLHKCFSQGSCRIIKTLRDRHDPASSCDTNHIVLVKGKSPGVILDELWKSLNTKFPLFVIESVSTT